MVFNVTICLYLEISHAISSLYLSQSHTGSGLWSYTSCLVPFQNCTKIPVSYLSAQPGHVTMIYINCTDSGQEQCTLLQYDWLSQLCHQTFCMLRIHSCLSTTFVTLFARNARSCAAIRRPPVSFIGLPLLSYSHDFESQLFSLLLLTTCPWRGFLRYLWQS